MWVEKKGERFILHCKEFPNCQQVTMAWADRKKLKIDGGVISVKTSGDILTEDREKLRRIITSRLKKRMERQIGDTDEKVLRLFALICALIVYARNQPPALATFFDEVIPDILDSFPLSRWKAILKTSLKDMDTLLHEYYNDLDGIP